MDLSGLVASKCGLMAVLEGSAQKIFIYNQERTDALEFPLDCDWAHRSSFCASTCLVLARPCTKPLLQDVFNLKILALRLLNQLMLCVCRDLLYRMAGNFGGEFILADWRF